MSGCPDPIERIHAERKRLWSEYRRKMDSLDRAETALTNPQTPRSAVVTRITDPRERR